MELIEQILKGYVEFTDEKLSEFFEPYYRSLGIKGKITKGKTRWRGLKMHIHENENKTTYQLFQRGIAITPILEIEFNYPIL
jgi:hypothetical protein